MDSKSICLSFCSGQHKYKYHKQDGIGKRLLKYCVAMKHSIPPVPACLVIPVCIFSFLLIPILVEPKYATTHNLRNFKVQLEVCNSFAVHWLTKDLRGEAKFLSLVLGLDSTIPNQLVNFSVSPKNLSGLTCCCF